MAEHRNEPLSAPGVTAERRHSAHKAAYLIQTPPLGDYLEEGLSQFGWSCTDFEAGRDFETG